MILKKHILIVDDSSHFRLALKAMINDINPIHEVSQAASGDEMLNILNKAEFDLIFIDIRMPGLSGPEACIKALNIQPKLNIIGFSSLEGCAYISSFIEAGANGYLSKNKNNYHLIKELLTNNETDLIISEGLDQECLYK